MKDFFLILKPYLEYELLQNSVQQILIAIFIFFAILIGLRIFRRIFIVKLSKLAEKTKTDLDDKLVLMIQNISRFFYWVIAFYISVQGLQTSSFINLFIQGIFIILLVYEVIKIVQDVLEFIIQKATHQKKSTAMAGVRLVIKIVLWSIGLLLILSNLGVNISALVASMGIGGIALALAAQNILGDLFSSFSIYFDKPFEIDDFITVGTDSGTVKKIGLKTTRLQTLQGEELVISNQELTTARVQNFKKLKRRRNVFAFGVTYDTKPEILKKIPQIVTDVINTEKMAEADRVTFTDFGDFSLNFSAIYYLDSPDYAEYAHTQHRINIALLEKFNAEGIEMAFPTQTIYMHKSA
jgi:small-conductance mechanosensitive channel